MAAKTLAAPQIINQPMDSRGTVGNNVVFVVSVLGQELFFQWQVSKDDGTTWKNVSTTYPSAKTPVLSFTVKKTMDGFLYRCIIQNAGGQIMSSEAKLSVDQKTLAILRQPQSTQVYDGTEATFSVEASGENPSYQWQVSKDKGQTWKNVSTKYPSAKTAIMSFTAKESMNGFLYQCIVTDTDGSKEVSAAVQLLVQASIKEPVMFSGPATKTVYEGAETWFGVDVLGDNLSYQWQVSKDGGSTWKNVSTKYPSAKTWQIRFTNTLAMDGYQYRCIIWNEYGRITSEAATLYVKAPSLGVEVDRLMFDGLRVLLRSSKPSNVYQWQISQDSGRTWINLSNDSTYSGVNSSMLSFTGSWSLYGNRYRCVNGNGEEISRIFYMRYTGFDHAQEIWNYLYAWLGNGYGAAGLMGNMFAESGLYPNNLENSYEVAFGMTDDEYTRKTDSGEYDYFVEDSAGYGLCQWTYYTRKAALKQYAKETGAPSIGDLQMQLGFLRKEIESDYAGLLVILQSAQTLREASDAVLTMYEMPYYQNEEVMMQREEYGQSYYDVFMK